MLGDRQDQRADGGSLALQANRDININTGGLSLTEVRELFTLLFRSNFPALREEARQAAEQNVLEFERNLITHLNSNFDQISLGKLADPDVQATINNAIQANARKGAKANPEILSKLIIERINRKSTDYRDVVLSEAVTVVPRLTSAQISFISLHHFIISMNPSASTIEELENVGQAGLAFSQNGFDLSNSQQQHIQYAGAASGQHSTFALDIYEILRTTFFWKWGFHHRRDLQSAITEKAPSYGALVDQFDRYRMAYINLTSVGHAIAISNISTYLGSLNYADWIN